MFYISVYDSEEKHLGWIDAGGHLIADKTQRAGFSSKRTANDMRSQLEEDNLEWYTELEES